jgi:uncharacterized protein (DUF433 family)
MLVLSLGIYFCIVFCAPGRIPNRTTKLLQKDIEFGLMRGLIQGMSGRGQTLLNTGIYTVPDAARLSSVSTGRIRRWLKGYRFRTKKQEEHRSPPLWQGQLEPIDKSLALGFLDLIEIRFVDAFLKSGVSWAMLRKAHEKGVALFRSPHPFCTNRFVTDGRDIFVKLHHETDERSLLEIVHDQHVFSEIIKPFILELEFDEADTLLRWRPATSRRLVVLDPTRNFGRPIVSEHGVPTEILARAAAACHSIQEVSRWYEVPEPSIEDAVEFERSLAA